MTLSNQSFICPVSITRSTDIKSLAQLLSHSEMVLVDLEQVKNPFEENEVVGITNYIDLGFELQTR